MNLGLISLTVIFTLPQRQLAFEFNILTPSYWIAYNAANHRRQNAERRGSGAFCRPSAFALLADRELKLASMSN